MQVTFKLLDKEHKLNRSLQDSAVKLFEKLDRYVPEPTQLDLRAEHIHSTRKGKTHYVHVAVAVTKEPRTFHAEALAEDFRTAFDRLYKKTERYLRKRHDKLIKKSRNAERKIRIRDWLSSTLSTPRRLLGRFRRRRE
ncbi:HPF/RaiA family ribosome-associated protein [Candidatus Berkelbacteria bacterium]|nr:HPF/RaiA family ribosome-associated protein [Candidatus Berkelbacteria bacterium]